MKTYLGVALLAASAAIVAATPASAQNAMQVCGAKYQAAKTAKTLPAGQTWQQFLASCRGTVKPAAATPAAVPAAPKPAVATKPAAAPMAAAPAARPAPRAAAAPGTPRQQTPGQMAAHDRQRQCGAQWKAAKAAGRIPAGQTWPQYWSQCNARMK